MRLGKREHPEAHEELLYAASWYDGEQLGLGEDFLDAVDAAVAQLLDWPSIAHVYSGWNREPVVHQGTMKTFPYQILYYIEDSLSSIWKCNVVVVAYAHNRRKPDYWKDRI